MRVFDWRIAEPADLDDAFAAEILRWQDGLGWDAGAVLAQVDEACRRGTLPGFVAVDAAGRISGWTWALRQGHALQIGALNATSAESAERLLDAVLGSSLAEDATSAIFFGYSSAPGLDRLLASRGFDVERYLYLERSTSGLAAGPEGASWRDSLREPVAVLLSASYDESRSRAFAREGGLDGWRDYLSQLVTSIGCGTFLPAGCQIVEGADSALEAAVLTTKISDHTVHLPQVVVAPHARGRGLATRLVEAALGIAHDAGFARATLLVGERNAYARRVYEKLGFRETAAFVSATRDRATEGRLSSLVRINVAL